MHNYPYSDLRLSDTYDHYMQYFVNHIPMATQETLYDTSLQGSLSIDTTVCRLVEGLPFVLMTTPEHN